MVLCYITTDATSVTSTLLRLISSFDESDGRCVHVLDCSSFHFYGNYYQVHPQYVFIVYISILY